MLLQPPAERGPGAAPPPRAISMWLVRPLLIVLLSLISAVAFNAFRPSPLAWNWRPIPPQAPLINDFGVFQEAWVRPETVLVDARDELFYRLGHIPGAQNLPADLSDLPAIKSWAEALPPQAEIIVYCSDEFCHMASELADKMISIGLKPRIFNPGFEAWEAGGLPVASEELD